MNIITFKMPLISEYCIIVFLKKVRDHYYSSMFEIDVLKTLKQVTKYNIYHLNYQNKS